MLRGIKSERERVPRLAGSSTAGFRPWFRYQPAGGAGPGPSSVVMGRFKKMVEGRGVCLTRGAEFGVSAGQLPRSGGVLVLIICQGYVVVINYYYGAQAG